MEKLAVYRRPVAIAVLVLAAAAYALASAVALRWLVPAGILLALVALAQFAAERRAVAKQPTTIATAAFYAARLVAPLLMLAVVAGALVGLAPPLDLAALMAVLLALVSLS